MCGLTGFIALEGRLQSEHRQVIESMTDAISHRGPDRDGYWSDAEAGIYLGHRRLSIIDLSSAGDQPMASASGRYVIAFNGEIYNHQDLREALMKRGAAPEWRGGSDTETLLACLDAFGIRETLEVSEGMFAFAAWDRSERRLILARDRFGEKPLYYGFAGNVFLFGSELKALMQHPAWQGKLDGNVLEDYLRFGCVGGSECIFQEIEKLPPACSLTLSAYDVAHRDCPSPSQWWSAADAAAEAMKDPTGSRSESVNLVEDSLGTSIKRRMVSDVPLGAFLSGGVDSSLITALMQQRSSQPVKTFSVGFDDARYDESHHAAAVADYLGTEHTTLMASSKMALDLVPRLPEMYDEPFADSSQLPTALICSLIREHVTVALSGDGGDELFGGYNRHVWVPKLWRKLRYLPHPARRVMARMLKAQSPSQYDRWFLGAGRAVPSRFRVRTFGEKIHKLAYALDSATEREVFNSVASMNPYAHEFLNSPNDPQGRAGDSLDAALCEFRGAEWMLLLDTLRYMVDDVLVKVDRASMASSLEVRVPFLDSSLFRTAWRIPVREKMRGGQNKSILRDLLYRHVPRTLIDRPKMGFAIPLDQWLRGPLREWCDDLLSPESVVDLPMLNQGAIAWRWQEHQAGNGNHAQALWSVLQLLAWQQRWRSAISG